MYLPRVLFLVNYFLGLNECCLKFGDQSSTPATANKTPTAAKNRVGTSIVMNFSNVNFNPSQGLKKSLGAEVEPWQDLQDFSSDNANAQCPSCGSTQVNLAQMPSHCGHYAARRCAGCDVFQGWEPKPEHQRKQQQRQITINQLLESPQLTQWERKFLTSLQSKRSLSPKQLATIQKIETKLRAAR